MTRPRILDLFCGAGGAAKGYHDAGFDVVGIDIAPQPRYPYEFFQADAVELMEDLIDNRPTGTDLPPLDSFDVIHASPPCQAYSRSRTRPRIRREHPRLIEPVRDLLLVTGMPYVIENVEGAPLHHPLMLCGGAFGLGARCADGRRRQLRRHRLFESSVAMMSPGCACNGTEKIGVYGNGGGWANRADPDRAGYKGNRAEARAAMGIDWMSVRELSESIPPAYTRFIGEQVLAHIGVTP